jgi:hypothetical protein
LRALSDARSAEDEDYAIGRRRFITIIIIIISPRCFAWQSMEMTDCVVSLEMFVRVAWCPVDILLI